MWPFSMKIELNEEQLADLKGQVLQDFKEQIGAQILKMHSTAFSKTIGEAIASEAEKWAPRYCKETQEKMEREINRWKLDQTFMKRLAKLETEMQELKAAQTAFQAKVQSQLEQLLSKLYQIMEGERPQPNGALQEIQNQLTEMDSRLTNLEITGKAKS